MPFHVAYSRKRRTIHLRDMAPDQFIFCPLPPGGVITLEGILNDYFNHRNVEFFWEQREGNIVVLSVTDDYITDYPFVDTTDKRFRLYIDKDTAREQWKDQRIFHTPTSFGSGSKNTISKVNHPATIRDITKIATFSSGGFSRMVTPTVPTVPAIKFNYTLPTEVDLILYPEKLEVLYSATATHNPTQIIDTLYPPYPTDYTVVSGFIKFRFYYDLPGQPNLFFDSELLLSTSAGVDTEATVTHTTDDLLPQMTTAYNFNSILRYRNSLLNVPALSQVTTKFFNRKLSFVNRFNNKSSIDNISIMAASMVYNFTETSIIRNDQSGIGHGS